MQLQHLHQLVRNYGHITSNQTSSSDNYNIIDDYTYSVFDSRTCDNMSAITDAVMAINSSTATVPVGVVFKQIWLKP